MAATMQINKGWARRLTGMPVPPHTGIYKLHLQASATLNSATVIESLKLPRGINEEEWIAAQMVSVLNEAECLVNVCTGEICTDSSCPRMCAGEYVRYSWADEKNPVPRALSAPQYMHTLLDWALGHFGDRTLVPINGSPLPPRFRGQMKAICKRLFRVWAHAYLHHFEELREGGVEAHINFCFKRYVFFVLHFDLVDQQDMKPLDDLIEKFMAEIREQEEAQAAKS